MDGALGQVGCFRSTQAQGRDPLKDACPEDPSPLPAGRWRIILQDQLRLETQQQINCSCALEFPQHTNLHDVKQLGGSPSMPRTEVTCHSAQVNPPAPGRREDLSLLTCHAPKLASRGGTHRTLGTLTFSLLAHSQRKPSEWGPACEETKLTLWNLQQGSNGTLQWEARKRVKRSPGVTATAPGLAFQSLCFSSRRWDLANLGDGSFLPLWSPVVNSE